MLDNDGTARAWQACSESSSASVADSLTYPTRSWKASKTHAIRSYRKAQCATTKHRRSPQNKRHRHAINPFRMQEFTVRKFENSREISVHMIDLVVFDFILMATQCPDCVFVQLDSKDTSLKISICNTNDCLAFKCEVHHLHAKVEPLLTPEASLALPRLSAKQWGHPILLRSGIFPPPPMRMRPHVTSDICC